MFNKKNYLTKNYMADRYYAFDRDSVYLNKKNFINFLDSIEKEFYTHDFDVDNRYVCLGRHRFLIDEMEELYYTKEMCIKLGLNTCPTVWCLSSLIEMIVNPNFLNLHNYEELIDINDIYLGKNVKEAREIYDSYNNDGIISLNERDYILHALNMIRDSLKKCNDNLEWEDNKQLQ
jgi:hypothetical protein